MTSDPTTLPAISPQAEVKAITTFIKKTFRSTGKREAIVAVSGGIDSAVALTLTVDALGADYTHAYVLPSLQSSAQNTDDALDLAFKLHLPQSHIHELNLAAAQEAVAKTLTLYSVEHTSSNLESRIGNIAARLRMIFIFDQAKALDALVIGTENLSEHYLGYFTRFGDEASDLEPLRHLYKTQIYRLAKHLELPQTFFDKPPSAGLWASQSDEVELGFTYAEADPILYQHFHKKQNPKQLLNQGFDPDLLDKVFTHLDSVAFKLQVPYLL